MTIDFVALAKAFPKSQVKQLVQKYTDKKGAQKQYTIEFITARHAMNRLDEVCGPANWKTEFSSDGLPPKTIRCTLFLRIDDEWVGKSDVGTPSNIEPEKGMVSDAFKRAAVHWGIARELYRAGTADLSAPEDDTAPPSELDAAEWVRNDDAKERMTNLRNKAALHWKDGEGKPMVYSHVYNRLAKIIGSESRPTSFPTFVDMMRADCKLSIEETWAAVESYKSESKG